MLLENGADPNKRYFFGAEINLITDAEGLELLLAFGAHTETRDRAGMTPLMKAARQNQVRHISLFNLSKFALEFMLDVTSLLVTQLN